MISGNLPVATPGASPANDGTSGDFRQEAHKAYEAFAAAQSLLLRKYHPDEAIRLMDAMPRSIAFDTYTKDVEQYWAAIERDLGAAALDAFQRLTMLRLIETFDERARAGGHVYTPAIVREFERHFGRIVRSLQDTGPAPYPTSGYFFRTDLSLCRQKALPAGFAILDLHQNYPRNLSFRAGLRQFFEVFWYALRYGHTDYYEAHLHPADRNFMNQENFHRHQLMVVDLLNANPSVEGYFGKGFFNDPEIHRISPGLGYIRANQPGCGFFFDSIQGPRGGALISKKRRELYERGEYVPKVYYGIWPRRAVMKWVKAFHRDHPDFDPTPDYSRTRDPLPVTEKSKDGSDGA